MKIPKLEAHQYSIILAENSTGIILNLDLTRFQEDKHNIPFQTFDNIDSAQFYAKNFVVSNPTIECLIYDSDCKFVQIVDKNNKDN